MMDERDLAAELQQARDSEDEWGDAEPVSIPKRKLTAMISIRLSEEELAAVQARAAALDESVSAYVRSLVVRDISSARVPPSTFWLSVSHSSFTAVNQWPPAPAVPAHA